MAQLPKLTDFFTLESAKPKASRASAASKLTFEERTVRQLRAEHEAFKAGKVYDSTAKARSAWIKDVDGEVQVSAKAGNAKLDFGGSKILHTDRKRLDKGVKLLIQHIEAGAFQDQFDAVRASMEARTETRKANKA